MPLASTALDRTPVDAHREPVTMAATALVCMVNFSSLMDRSLVVALRALNLKDEGPKYDRVGLGEFYRTLPPTLPPASFISPLN